MPTIKERKTLIFKVDSWQHKMEMELHKMRLEFQKGVWCGYKYRFTAADTKISYQKLLHSSTNMKNPGIGLDTSSG